MASLRGEPVDRPAVNFYEIGGFTIDPKDPDPFNVYNDPSWRPLLELADEYSDRISFASPRVTPLFPEERAKVWSHESWQEGASRFGRMTLRIAGRTMTELVRRDAGVSTVWTLEHLLETEEDVEAYLQIPDECFAHSVDVSRMAQRDNTVGDAGIVMADTADPLCLAAALFSMEDFTVVAFTNQALFHRLLQKLAAPLYRTTEIVAREFPGHLWRIYGPEYATPPYLPPRLFHDYVVEYDSVMVREIQRHGGFARIHCHGNLSAVLPYIYDLGADALDPIEPPPQGDVKLADVRREYGAQMTLFGNLESSDIENMEPAEFEKVVAQSLRDGTSGQGRGFVLTPTAAPYGRTITDRTLANYRTMVRLACSMG